MEKKVRYKLHKVKKQWVTIAVASAALTGVVGVTSTAASSVSADEVTATTAATTEDGTSTSTQTSEAATATSSEETSATVTVATSDSESAANVSAASSEETSAVSETSTATSVSSEETSTAVTSESASTAAVSEAPVTSTVSKETTETDQTSDLSKTEVSAALSLENVKLVDGSYYYVNEDGTYKKNFAITVNGQLLYFGETGALTSTSTYSFSTGTTKLTDAFTANNKAYDSTAASFELVDGYLTANSWYRPANILEDGKTWVESTEEDLRPLLMAWWPDVDTQVDYLNYMSEYFGLNTTYTADQGQDALNTAAKAIQVKIEQTITAKKSTEWLRDTIEAFVATQSKWNKDTENYTKGSDSDHLQGGALLYVNSDLTEWANSDYRLLNRTPTNQSGSINEAIVDKDSDKTNIGGYDFLLANDVDNSNPVVQAEQLNQLYYLMNWGTIVFGDDSANFDGVRVDAVDNVNADLLQIYTNLFEAAYGVNESEANALAHISILEAWNYNDNHYNEATNGAALAMENKQRLALLYSLAKPISERTVALSPLYNNTFNTSYTDVAKSETDSYKVGVNNTAYGDTDASYVFIRAHDNQVQDIIKTIVQDKINPESDGFTLTTAELEEAFKYYNEDMNSADKQYTLSNIPAAYALMLSNMEVVTRVYYGDLYTDNGQYMETKSPYYDAITTLLKNRYKYVSGGQTMKSQWLTGDGSMAQYDAGSLYASSEVVTSVRYGKDIMSADDTEGSEDSRTSGMLTIVSNNPKLSLYEEAKLEVEMGKVHANQAYRPLLLGTKDGIVSYASDADAEAAGLIKYTDENGVLTFNSSDIKGYSTVDMSGYLAVWVPVGASEDQDLRVAASTEAYKEGDSTYQATEALDSQVIYEGFSNFQAFVENDSQYTNKLIAQNVELFKSWGITSFEMAPQYVSATDGSFLDSVIQNGYAFTDRYDLAMSQNNKYGSKEDLRDALKALHSVGIQAIADWVPDQIYQLPGEEVVTATRTDNYGKTIQDPYIENTLYVANTKSSGEDYQAQYGGEFLAELQEKYPELFTAKMISTGEVIDPSVKIKQWKAEYFNGTNVLNRGAEYVLSDASTGTYFTVNEDGTFIPLQLTGDEEAVTGFYNDGKGLSYYGTSGYKAVSSFVKFNGNYYYFDENGYMVTGKVQIGDSAYYFLPNGIQLRNANFEDADGNVYYFGVKGDMFADGYYSFDVETTDEDGKTSTSKVWRYFDTEGVMAVGLKTIDGFIQYFDEDGVQVKDKLVTLANGSVYYLQAGSGNAVTNTWKESDGSWYYFGSKGAAVTGAQTINGQKLYFNKDGKQVKGAAVKNSDGTLSYYDADTGEKWVNAFFTTGDNVWYYIGANGKTVTGSQVINGQQLYFDKDGKQVKGATVKNSDGTLSYYDADTGVLVQNTFITTGDNAWYYIGANGKTVTGAQVINGQSLYFGKDGKQAKGRTVLTGNGRINYYDANTGEKAVNAWVTFRDGTRVYFDGRGNAVI